MSCDLWLLRVEEEGGGTSQSECAERKRALLPEAVGIHIQEGNSKGMWMLIALFGYQGYGWTCDCGWNEVLINVNCLCVVTSLRGGVGLDMATVGW